MVKHHTKVSTVTTSVLHTEMKEKLKLPLSAWVLHPVLIHIQNTAWMNDIQPSKYNSSQLCLYSTTVPDVGADYASHSLIGSCCEILIWKISTAP